MVLVVLACGGLGKQSAIAALPWAVTVTFPKTMALAVISIHENVNRAAYFSEKDTYRRPRQLSTT